MAPPLNPNDLVTFEELTITNMWEVAAIREVLEKKGLLSKPEIFDANRELRRQNPTHALKYPPPPSSALGVVLNRC